MQINTVDNNSFGKIYCPDNMRIALERMLRKKCFSGNVDFAQHFADRWKACQNAKCADLHILDSGDVFVKGKTFGTIKKINSFSNTLYNADSGMKHVLLAEEQKMKI